MSNDRVYDKLYLDKDRFKSVKSIIEYMYPKNEVYCIKHTYFDKNCSERQCSAKRRSIDDIIIIVRTYFPKSPIKKILKALEDCNMSFYFCDTIERIVFHRVSDAHLFYKDAFQNYISRWKYDIESSEKGIKSANLINRGYNLELINND